MNTLLEKAIASELWFGESLEKIVALFNDGSNEALDGDEVDDLIFLLNAQLNLFQGNLTQEEYMDILVNRESIKPEITVSLPDGRKLIAMDKQDPDYPGIRIELEDTDGSRQLIAWAEYDAASDDVTPNQRLRQILWNKADDEPVVTMEYDTGKIIEER